MRPQYQRLGSPVPTVPTVPTEKGDAPVCGAADAHVETWIAWAERAAICEFCGGHSRAEAEAAAASELHDMITRGGMVV